MQAPVQLTQAMIRANLFAHMARLSTSYAESRHDWEDLEDNDWDGYGGFGGIDEDWDADTPPRDCLQIIIDMAADATAWELNIPVESVYAANHFSTVKPPAQVRRRRRYDGQGRIEESRVMGKQATHAWGELRPQQPLQPHQQPHIGQIHPLPPPGPRSNIAPLPLEPAPNLPIHLPAPRNPPAPIPHRLIAPIPPRPAHNPPDDEPEAKRVKLEDGRWVAGGGSRAGMTGGHIRTVSRSVEAGVGQVVKRGGGSGGNVSQEESVSGGEEGSGEGSGTRVESVKRERED